MIALSAVVAEVEVDVVEAVERARVEASSRCSSTKLSSFLPKIAAGRCGG